MKLTPRPRFVSEEKFTFALGHGDQVLEHIKNNHSS